MRTVAGTLTIGDTWGDAGTWGWEVLDTDFTVGSLVGTLSKKKVIKPNTKSVLATSAKRILRRFAAPTGQSFVRNVPSPL